jgi:insulysin
MEKMLFILFAFSQLLATQAVVIEDKSNLKILTPSFKDRKTLKLKLENGLSVYIISDKQIDQSSAALCVKAGSWQDPKQYPGMAHFTEHMLFMGSKTYPGENAFMNYIWDHGGSPNAYTACDRTVYGFSILNESFVDGLKRFSHFFIDPIFPPEGMKKELHAVDQEYAKNIENDGWRKYMIEKELANFDHPHHGFSTGNSKTLSHIPQNIMIKWFEEHYSANNMYLFISSPLDIEELKKITIEQFSKIPDRKLDPFDQKADVFSKDQKGKIVF